MSELSTIRNLRRTTALVAAGAILAPFFAPTPADAKPNKADARAARIIEKSTHRIGQNILSLFHATQKRKDVSTFALDTSDNHDHEASSVTVKKRIPPIKGSLVGFEYYATAVMQRDTKGRLDPSTTTQLLIYSDRIKPGEKAKSLESVTINDDPFSGPDGPQAWIATASKSADDGTGYMVHTDSGDVRYNGAQNPDQPFSSSQFRIITNQAYDMLAVMEGTAHDPLHRH